MRLRFILLMVLSVVFGKVSLAAGLTDPIKIAPHSYAWIGPYGPPTKENQGFRMNMGFVVGKDAVAVIDSGYSDAMANVMLKQISKITKQPVRYVINTNSQPHRILGNAVFKKHGATLIASIDAVPRITTEGASMARTAEDSLGLAREDIHAPPVPDRALKENTTLDLGGVTLKVSPVGTAHTPGCLTIEVVEDKVIYAGDILYGGRLLAVLPVSRVDGWINAFDALRAFENNVFVPGHGKPGKLMDFEHSTFEYLTKLKTHMDAAINQGTDLQDAIRSLDQSPWQDLADFDALSGRNAHQTYLEREAAAFE